MKTQVITKLLFTIFFACLATAQRVPKPIQAKQAVSNPISIVVGPIIGKVTNTTARVLFEFDTTTTITVNLTDPNGNTTSVAKNVTADTPVVFAFEGLLPNTTYNVTLNDSSINMTRSYFTTLSGESGKLNFAVVSCMDRKVQASKEPEADLWANLLQRVENREIHYLLQTGDQVYMDDPFGKEDLTKPYYASMKILNETSPEKWNSTKPDILKLLRDEYRLTWSLPSVKETLAKVPTLTILDDHQVRDDWGYLAQDYNESSPEYFYGLLARQVFYEYERQLREDIDFSNFSNMTTEYYYIALNDVGFFFLDYRGTRTWNRPYNGIDNTQLGTNQTKLLKQVLDPEVGTFANLSHFFLVGPLTVVFLVESMVKIGYYSNNDAEESWTYGYEDEQAALMKLLRDWKLAKQGRDVTILAGDVHMGGYTDITYNGEFAFLQFTTSSIASSAPNDYTFFAFEGLKEVQNLVDPWSYEHHDWTNDFNYGMVIVDKNNETTPVGCYMVKAPSDEAPRIIGPNGDEINESGWSGVLDRLINFF